MKIVALAPFIVETLLGWELGSSLVGVPEGCLLPEELKGLPVVAHKDGSDNQSDLAGQLATGYVVNIPLLKELAPDIILTRVRDEEDPHSLLIRLRAKLHAILGESVKLYSYHPRYLDSVYEYLTNLGRDVGLGLKGREAASRIKAQFMDWADNFYDRMKNKRVAVIAGIEPLTLAGFWVPDMIHLNSGVSAHKGGGTPSSEITWDDFIKFRPDVILVAPEGMALQDSMKSFKYFEKLPHWDDIPAVKRGEVFFCGGDTHFYSPTHSLIESMAVLVSATAGFDSGYITKRDSFYRLRWLEMHRHKV